jgi:hypothetical protein
MTVTADEVLIILNDLEPVDLSTLTIVVITAGAREHFDVARQRMETVAEPNFWPFRQGEILVLADSGREPFGEGRKPAKWSVTCEEFETLAAALARRAEVLAAPAKFIH